MYLILWKYTVVSIKISSRNDNEVMNIVKSLSRSTQRVGQLRDITV